MKRKILARASTKKSEEIEIGREREIDKEK